jgi:hypothetical protein
MAEPSLDCPSVVAIVGQGVAAGVAQHVRVRLHFKAGGNRRPLDHAGKASGRERGSPLADEDKRRRLALPLEPAQGPEFAAAKRVGAGGAVLDPPHVQDGAVEVEASAARSPCRKATRIMVASR